jgi:hypothetical protein
VNHTQTSSTSVTPAPRPPSHQRPWFAYSGWLLSALQIPLTIYFYRLSVITPEFTSHVHPTRTPIVKALKESRLQVSYDGQPITNDVTAVQIAIWNAGRQSIRPQHLLKPVELLLTNSTRILEAKVLKSSRDVTRLAAMVPITDPGHVQLSWDILEHNDGGILQIIYSGPPDASVTFTGAVEGQPVFPRTYNPEPTPKKWFHVIALLVWIVALIWFFSKAPTKISWRGLLLVLSIGVLSAYTLFFFLPKLLQPAPIPFTF